MSYKKRNKKQLAKIHNDAYQKEIDRVSNMTPEERLEDRRKRLARTITNNLKKIAKDFSDGLGLDKV